MRFSGKSDQVSLYGKRFFRVSPIDEERRWHHGYHGLPVKLESPLNFQVNFRFRDFRGACVGLVSGSIVSSAAMIGAVHRSSQSQLYVEGVSESGGYMWIPNMATI